MRKCRKTATRSLSLELQRAELGDQYQGHDDNNDRIGGLKKHLQLFEL